MKKKMVIAFGLLLLIPIVLMLGGLLLNLINPEIAAGHPNYVRNFHLLSLLRLASWFTSIAAGAILWMVACFLIIQSKQRSWLWLFLAALGPLGFAILMSLNERVSEGADRHARFVRHLNMFMRVGYEVCRFAIIWLLAYQSMVLQRNLMILYQSASTGISTAQIIDQQNASSGMWAFGEGLEVMYLVVLFYLLWPVLFNFIGGVVATLTSSRAR